MHNTVQKRHVTGDHTPARRSTAPAPTGGRGWRRWSALPAGPVHPGRHRRGLLVLLPEEALRTPRRVQSATGRTGHRDDPGPGCHDHRPPPGAHGGLRGGRGPVSCRGGVVDPASGGQGPVRFRTLGRTHRINTGCTAYHQCMAQRASVHQRLGRFVDGLTALSDIPQTGHCVRPAPRRGQAVPERDANACNEQLAGLTRDLTVHETNANCQAYHDCVKATADVHAALGKVLPQPPPPLDPIPQTGNCARPTVQRQPSPSPSRMPARAGCGWRLSPTSSRTPTAVRTTTV